MVISAITIAHSSTLVLSALGILSLHPVVTESLIALSIVYVGIENVVRKTQSKRWIVAGSFGLTQGAGCSSQLTQLLKSKLGLGNIFPPLQVFYLGSELVYLIVVPVVFPFPCIRRRLGM